MSVCFYIVEPKKANKKHHVFDYKSLKLYNPYATVYIIKGSRNIIEYYHIISIPCHFQPKLTTLYASNPL